MNLTENERRYLLRARDRAMDLTFEKYAAAARPTLLKLVEKGLMQRAEIEGDDELEIYEITEAGELAIGIA